MPHSKNKEDDLAAAPKAPEFKVKDPQAVIDSATATGDEDKKKRVIKPLTTGCQRPVIIHRAMAGSIERFTGECACRRRKRTSANHETGILIEHFAGKWPFWLSPRQIMVIPVGKGFIEYAEEVQSIFKKQGMWWYVALAVPDHSGVRRANTP